MDLSAAKFVPIFAKFFRQTCRICLRLMLLSLSSGFLGVEPGLVAGGEGGVVVESAFEA